MLDSLLSEAQTATEQPVLPPPLIFQPEHLPLPSKADAYLRTHGLPLIKPDDLPQFHPTGANLSSASLDRAINGQAVSSASIAGFARAELDLIATLPENFSQAFVGNLKNNWSTLAEEAGIGLLAGAAIGSAVKNPALLGRTIGQICGHANPAEIGEAMAAIVKPTVRALPYLFGYASTIDIGHRVGAPAWDLMLHPENKKADALAFASNTTSLIQDYTASGVAGLMGAKFALDRTAPYVNRGPKVDFSTQQEWAAANPQKLNKGARFKNPSGYVFQEEHEIKPDVEEHYNAAFPAEERQAVHGEGGYNEKIAQGANLVYTLRNKETGELAAAHILGLHDQPDPLPQSQGLVKDFSNWLTGKQPPQLQSMHGDFIFVREDLRSQGTGSHMYDLVLDAAQKRAQATGKKLVAVTGEMEAPEETAQAMIAAINEHSPGAVSEAEQKHPLAWARQLLASLKEIPNLQDQDPAELGRTFLGRFGSGEVTGAQAQEVGENLQTLDERIRRQEFYWALPKPKVDSGIRWNIQDFNDPQYRGPAHWTSVVFDRLRFAPRETGYAFMTDEAGYTLPADSAQVRQYMQENNYYRGNATTAYASSALLGALGKSQKRSNSDSNSN